MYGKQTLSGFSPPSLTCTGGSFKPLKPPPPPPYAPENSAIYDIHGSAHVLQAVFTLYRGVPFHGATRSYPVQCGNTYMYPTCDSTLQRSARHSLSLSQKSRRHNRFFFCVNRSPTQYGFRGGAKAFRYTVNIALTFIHFPDN